MLACMVSDRYPHKPFRHFWNIKPRRGRQRKSWSRVVDDLLSSLNLDKAEWVEDIQKGECSLKGFLSVVGESIDWWESRKFKGGLDSKLKLLLYKIFCKAVEFKVYLHGACDAGPRLDQVLMVLMRSWVDIEEGRGEKSAYFVMMNVRALVMFCGIVWSTIL